MTASEPLHQRARAILTELTGNPGAQFRDGQFEAIEFLVDQRSRVLVVQRTGWGKSAVYFVAARLLREQGAGPTLIISPLIALMRDQVNAATRAGVKALTINSANATEWDDVLHQVRAGDVDVLLISPERLTNPTFVNAVLTPLENTLGMIVVDEAHCISDWGHDFRPDYRRIGALLEHLPANTPVLATTATANSRVVDDVAAQLGHNTRVIRGPLSRASLRLGVAGTTSAAYRIAWLTEHLNDFTGSGIIYTLTKSAAQDIATALSHAGHAVAAYTGSTDPEERIELEDALKGNALKALVATSALGMGFDKPDLGFVIHVGAPSSAVAYYQQVGRAGRATDSADVLLLPGHDDENVWEYFANATMPNEQDATAVLDALGDEPRSVPALEPLVGIKRNRLELLLKVLTVDGAAQRVRGGYVRTGVPWTYDAGRYAAVAQTRADEAREMLAYEKTTKCRMVFLAGTLDDETAVACGRCDTCAGVWWNETVSAQAQTVARSELDRVGLIIEPRKQWPAHLNRIGVNLSGKIPVGQQCEPGRAVARLSDLGPGQVLREFLAPGAPDQPIPNHIGQLVTQVLSQWGWKAGGGGSGANGGGSGGSAPPRPEVVVAVPGFTRPNTVESLARGIATTGRMEYAGALDALKDPGSPDVNSPFRVKNLHDAFAVSSELAARVNGRVVLLVDAEVVSRWTFAITGRLLREAGATSVLPFALAQRG